PMNEKPAYGDVPECSQTPPKVSTSQTVSACTSEAEKFDTLPRTNDTQPSRCRSHRSLPTVLTNRAALPWASTPAPTAAAPPPTNVQPAKGSRPTCCHASPAAVTRNTTSSSTCDAARPVTPPRTKLTAPEPSRSHTSPARVSTNSTGRPSRSMPRLTSAPL